MSSRATDRAKNDERSSAAAMLLRQQSSRGGAAQPAKRARVTRGPDDVPSGTRVADRNKRMGSVESFERAALGALLWRRPEANELADIPTEFRDARHYITSFEPVLLEETREEARGRAAPPTSLFHLSGGLSRRNKQARASATFFFFLHFFSR